MIIMITKIIIMMISQAEDSTGRILIARVMHGGAADRSGLISVGDEVSVVMMLVVTMMLMVVMTMMVMVVMTMMVMTMMVMTMMMMMIKMAMMTMLGSWRTTYILMRWCH